jgi:serine/threonine protein kinase
MHQQPPQAPFRPNSSTIAGQSSGRTARRRAGFDGGEGLTDASPGESDAPVAHSSPGVESARATLTRRGPKPILGFVKKKIGRYEVESEVGRGAMGVVYVAHDPRVSRRVAVKTVSLPAGLDARQKEEYRERFLREAQAAGRLSHPGIVTVYDVDEDAATGESFIAMEYVPGQSLAALQQGEGGIEPERAYAIVEAVSDALRVAHEAGIVHRDIKPANIMVREPDGVVKIADFGIARVTTSELTQEGTSLGSPAYMSPEQVRGAEVDGRSDLFALGVILYELLCGERPFNGDDPTALAYAVVHETPVPVTRRVAGLPAGLDRFFDRALAKDPAGRFSDAAVFKQALCEARRGEGRVDAVATVVEASPRRVGPPRSASSVPRERRTSEGPGQGVPLPFSDTDIGTSGRGRGRRRSVLGFVAATLLVLGAWALFGGGGDAYLKLDAKSAIEAGRLTVEIDGEEVFSRRLSAPQKKGLLKKVLDQNQETFEAWIEVEPGKHEVIASVLPDGADSGYRDTVVVDLDAGETRRLRLVAGRSFGTPLSLKVH